MYRGFPMGHDIEGLAYLAVIGICLTLVGALLTAGPVTVEQRGAVLSGILIVLFTVAWRVRHRGPRPRQWDDRD